MSRWECFWIEWDAAGDNGPAAGDACDVLWVALAMAGVTLTFPLLIWLAG